MYLIPLYIVVDIYYIHFTKVNHRIDFRFHEITEATLGCAIHKSFEASTQELYFLYRTQSLYASIGIDRLLYLCHFINQNFFHRTERACLRFSDWVVYSRLSKLLLDLFQSLWFTTNQDCQWNASITNLWTHTGAVKSLHQGHTILYQAISAGDNSYAFLRILPVLLASYQLQDGMSFQISFIIF